jgi:hypothetical protein
MVRGRVPLVWGALVIYALLALIVFSSTWVDPAGSWIGSPKDPRLVIWYLGWIPHELALGHNPLFTDFLSYPHGVNLMWNTSMIFPAMVLWPVTAIFGPVVAYNVLITAGIALSAWFGLLAARRFIDSPWLCLVAGFIYGFSPALLAQALGHPHVMVALFPPIALIVGHEILVRRRMRPTRVGALAGVAAALQLLTGEEVLAVTLMIAVIGVALLALLHRAEVRARFDYAARATGAAVLAFAIIAAYPLDFQFLGPQRVSGNFQPPDVYVSDLAAFILPAQFVHFTGNATENGAYVGAPLVLLFIAGLVAGWRRPWIRWTGLMTVIVAVLSLGPHLHVNGHIIPIPLPWTLVALLPLMGSALPARLMAIAFLGVGLVAAGVSRMAMRARRPWRIAADALLAAGVVALFPALPYATAPATVPDFFKPGGDVEKIAAGSVVLVTPFSSHVSTDAMYWQTVSGYRFRMPEGDAFTPGPYLGPHPSFMQSTLDSLDAGQMVTVTPDVRDAALTDLRAFGVTTVVAGPSPGRAAIVAFLTDVLGAAPVDDGGVEVWWSATPH